MPEDKTEEGLVFYYSRARRLEKASEAVRRLNDPVQEKRPGIFRALVATKSRAMLFFSIALVCAAMLFISVLDRFDGGAVALGKNSVSVSAVRYEETAFIILKKTVKKAGAYTGVVDLAVSAPSTAQEERRGPRTEISRLVFTSETEEDFRFSVPFAPAELLLVMQAGEERVSRRIKVE